MQSAVLHTRSRKFVIWAETGRTAGSDVMSSCAQPLGPASEALLPSVSASAGQEPGSLTEAEGKARKFSGEELPRARQRCYLKAREAQEEEF